MIIPKSFVPKKNFEEELREMTKFTMEELIEDKIGGYKKSKEYDSDILLLSYINIQSVIRCVTLDYSVSFHNDSFVEVTILEFDDLVKTHLKELADEFDKGYYKDDKSICCLIKREFAIIIINPSQYNPALEEDLDLFKRHYKEKFGFC